MLSLSHFFVGRESFHTEQTTEEILDKVEEQAAARYSIKAIVRRYMESIEEVINIPELMDRFNSVLQQGKGGAVIEEIVLQSRVEFNVEADEATETFSYRRSGNSPFSLRRTVVH